MVGKLHLAGVRTEPLALGPGGSAGSVLVPVMVCGAFGYGVELTVNVCNVTCKSCKRTRIFREGQNA